VARVLSVIRTLEYSPSVDAMLTPMASLVANWVVEFCGEKLYIFFALDAVTEFHQ